MTDAVANLMNTLGMNNAAAMTGLTAGQTSGQTSGMQSIEGITIDGQAVEGLNPFSLVLDGQNENIDAGSSLNNLLNTTAIKPVGFVGENPFNKVADIAAELDIDLTQVTQPSDIINMIKSSDEMMQKLMQNPLFANAVSTNAQITNSATNSFMDGLSFDQPLHMLPQVDLESAFANLDKQGIELPVSPQMIEQAIDHMKANGFPMIEGPLSDFHEELGAVLSRIQPLTLAAGQQSADTAVPTLLPASKVPENVAPIVMPIKPVGQMTTLTVNTDDMDPIVADGVVTKVAPTKMAAMKGPNAHQNIDADDVATQNANSNANAQTAAKQTIEFQAGLRTTLENMNTAPAVAMMNKVSSGENFGTIMKALGIQPNTGGNFDQNQALSALTGDSQNGGQFGSQSQGFGQQSNTPHQQQQAPWTMAANGQTMGSYSWQGSESWSQFSETLAMDQNGAFGAVSSGLTGIRGDISSPLMTPSSPLAQQALTHQAAEQVGLSIQKQSAEGIDNFKISLKPAELGTVKISMNFAADGKVQATILAERPETLDMLRNENKAIERALADAGHRLDKTIINYDLDQQNGGNAGKAWAESIRDERHDDMMNKFSAANSDDEDGVSWSEEDEISLDDIIPFVTPETGLDISI